MADLKDVLKRGVDRAKGAEGVWTTVLVGDVEIPVRIASERHSKAFKNRVLEHIKPLLQEQEQTLSEEEIGEAWARVLAGTVLVDWELSYEARPIPFSEDGAVDLMLEVPDFREAVRRKGRDKELFRFDDLKEATDRLGKSLSGESDTATSSETKPSKSESKEDTEPKAGTTG